MLVFLWQFIWDFVYLECYLSCLSIWKMIWLWHSKCLPNTLISLSSCTQFFCFFNWHNQILVSLDILFFLFLSFYNFLFLKKYISLNFSVVCLDVVFPYLFSLLLYGFFSISDIHFFFNSRKCTSTIQIFSPFCLCLYLFMGFLFNLTFILHFL